MILTFILLIWAVRLFHENVNIGSLLSVEVPNCYILFLMYSLKIISKLQELLIKKAGFNHNSKSLVNLIIWHIRNIHMFIQMQFDIYKTYTCFIYILYIQFVICSVYNIYPHVIYTQLTHIYTYNICIYMYVQIVIYIKHICV